MKEHNRSGGTILMDKAESLLQGQESQFLEEAAKASVKDMAQKTGGANIIGKEGNIYEGSKGKNDVFTSGSYWGDWSVTGGQRHVNPLKLTNLIYGRVLNQIDHIRRAV